MRCDVIASVVVQPLKEFGPEKGSLVCPVKRATFEEAKPIHQHYRLDVMLRTIMKRCARKRVIMGQRLKLAGKLG